LYGRSSIGIQKTSFVDKNFSQPINILHENILRVSNFNGWALTRLGLFGYRAHRIFPSNFYASFFSSRSMSLLKLEKIQYCKYKIRDDSGNEQPLIPFHFLRRGVSQKGLRHLGQVNGLTSLNLGHQTYSHLSHLKALTVETPTPRISSCLLYKYYIECML
jgi:hypothetical protein